MGTLPPRRFAPSIAFHFAHVRKVIAIVEEAVERAKKETHDEQQARARKAAANPFHNFIENPVFAPMGEALWEAQVTLPTILRNSLLIAIYSHVEHALLRWCSLLHKEWSLSKSIDSFKRKEGESTPHRYLRYMRDEAGVALGDFEQWPEWSKIDAYREARNCLAHDGGIVVDADKRAKIASLPQVQVDDSGLLSDYPVVHLLPGACEAAAETANSFLSRMAEVCQQDPRANANAGGT